MMDLEQLKLILEMAQKAGESGSDLFIFYVLMNTLPGIIGSIIAFSLAFLVGLVGYRLLKSNIAGERLRKAARVSYEWEDSEIRAAEACLKTHYREFRDKVNS